MSEADSDLLSAYIDQQLSSSERAALERRLEQEPELRLALDELRATVEVLRALPPVTPPRSFTLPASARSPQPWLSLGMLRFGSAFASVLLVLTFLPALLRVDTMPIPASAPAMSPTRAVAYESAGLPTPAPEATAGSAMMPQAALEPTAPPEGDSAAIVAAEPTLGVPADAPADNAQARLLAETANALAPAPEGPEPRQGQPDQPATGNASDTSGATGGAASPPIATSGSSSPGTTILEQPAETFAPASPVPTEPPISALNLLRLALAVTAVGFAVAFWRRREQEQW
ncbi:MAG TPA: hypothetical protein VFS21_09485 [Roseiflexaceae bacterium]|nr:hypothetical protein [Roseiflexaceae bacterium]